MWRLNNQIKMKQKIIEGLKTKFTGVEDKTIERICEKLLAKTTPANEEEVKKLVEGVTFKQVMESYADARVTEATKSAIENYEKKHNIKDGKKLDEPGDPGKPDPQPKPKPGEGDDMPAWAKQLIEDNKAMKKRLEDNDTEKTTAKRKGVLSKAIDALPQSFKSKFEKDFARMTFKDDEDFKNWVDNDLKADVETITKEINVKGATFGRPKGGSGAGKDGINETLKAMIDERQKADEKKASPIIGG